MRYGRARRLAAAAMLTAMLPGAVPGPALADSLPPGQVLSNFENYFAANIVRDCGYSQPLPADLASSLWLFCDTDGYAFGSSGQWQLSKIISGSTAAEGAAQPGQVPTGLSELTTPGSGVPPLPNHDGPAQFLPTPAGLVTPGGLPCNMATNSYAASWLSGVTQDVTRPSDVLVSFTNFCVPIGGGTPRAAGFGLAEYDPAANILDHEATVFTAPGPQPLAAQEQLGSPVFAGGYLYLFAAHCAGDYDLTCIPGDGNAVYLARVPADPVAWDDPAAYQWQAGPAGWTAAPCAAVSVISGATPLAVNVNEFSALGHGLVLVEQTSSTGGYRLYQAAQPDGPWAQLTSGTVPCAVEGDSLCRAIIAHPELSTGRDVLLSYFDPSAAPYHYPSAGPEGHVVVTAVPW